MQRFSCISFQAEVGTSVFAAYSHSKPRPGPLMCDYFRRNLGNSLIHNVLLVKNVPLNLLVKPCALVSMGRGVEGSHGSEYFCLRRQVTSVQMKIFDSTPSLDTRRRCLVYLPRDDLLVRLLFCCFIYLCFCFVVLVIVLSLLRLLLLFSYCCSFLLFCCCFVVTVVVVVDLVLHTSPHPLDKSHLEEERAQIIIM